MNAANPEWFATPDALLEKLNFTGKDEMFLIVNDFSIFSPDSTLPKYKRPSSLSSSTSGLTPIPFNYTETVVCYEYINNFSSYGCWASGSN